MVRKSHGGLIMKVVDFDSSQYAKQLRDAGLPEPVADIEAETMGEMARYLAALSAQAEEREVRAEAARRESDARIGVAIAGLNAKIDTEVAGLHAKVDTAVAGLNAKISCLGAELREKMAANQSEVIRWVVTVGILQFALVGALVLKLVH